MTPHQKNYWREEFDAKFSAWETDDEGIKAFIETLLTQQAERIAEEVAGIAGVFAEDEKGNDILLIKKSDAVNLIRTRNT